MDILEKYKEKVSKQTYESHQETPTTTQTDPDTVMLEDGCTGDNLTCDYSVFKEKRGIRWVECLCPGAFKLSCPFQGGDWWEAHLKRKEVEKRDPVSSGTPGSQSYKQFNTI
jgi:hypothetical protein